MINLNEQLTKYLDNCKYQKNLSDKTIKAYRIDINQFIKYVVSINSLNNPFSQNTIEEYIKSLYDNYKTKTIKWKIASVKAFTYHMEYYNIIEFSPFHKIKTSLKEPKRLPKIVPINILQTLIEYPNQQLIKPNISKYKILVLTRNIAILELLLASGIRISELCNLSISNINWIDKTIDIIGKGDKERIIQLGNKTTLKALKSYYTLCQTAINNNDFFFINKYGKRLSEQSVRMIIRTYVAKTQIKMKITPHMFRHTFATSLLEDDVDIRYIQQLLGHSSIVTTQIYTAVTSNKQKSIMTKRNPMNKIHL